MQTTKEKTKKKILVIGGVAAGSSSASKAKRIDPDADVKIIQDENVVSYGACGIPYVIEGIINDFEELIERPPDIFKNEHNIDIIVNTRAHKINKSLDGFLESPIFIPLFIIGMNSIL
jgi:NADPH-dependent 2,4-dienoyl-CoA reductase/sulfur reductase-like enzyme